MAVVVASAANHGLTVQLLDHVRARQDVLVRLQPERVVRGRLVHADGKPATGVEIRVHVPPYVDAPDPSRPGVRVGSALGREFCYVPPEGAFWPKPVITDDQGRFLVRGLGPGKANIVARRDGITPNSFAVETVVPGGQEENTLKLRTSPLLEGRITEKGTGKPVAGARLLVTDRFGTAETRTDHNGRYAVRPFPGQPSLVIVHPPEGSACLVTRAQLTLVAKDREEFNLSLPVGVLVRGRVAEAESGKPVQGARVQYRRRGSNLFCEEGDKGNGRRQRVLDSIQTAFSGADGRFELAVPTGQGHLFVLGPTLEYLRIETSLGELENGRPGAFRYYPNAVVTLDLKQGIEAPEVTAVLRRGVSLRRRVVGPDGKPVANFRVLCRSYIPTGWHQWNPGYGNWLECRDGNLEVPGCDPKLAFTAWLWDNENELGGTVRLSPRKKDAPEPIRLQPCGTAVVRFEDPDGRPLAHYASKFYFLMDPGDFEPLNFSYANRPLEFNMVVMGVLTADAEGKATLRNLIPGATYRRHSLRQVEIGSDSEVPYTLVDFTVLPGETRFLPFRDGYAPALRGVTYVDLQAKTNRKLKECFHGPVERGNNRAELKPGKQVLGDAKFDVGTGLIQLANDNLKDDLPEKVEGIKLDAKFTKLHILHSTTYTVADDTVIAKYAVHYEDQSAETIEVVYGKDVRDWWRKDGDKEPTRGNVAWRGSNDVARAAERSLWLFSLTWKNPHPGKKVVSIDYVSTLSEAAPGQREPFRSGCASGRTRGAEGFSIGVRRLGKLDPATQLTE
jgi:hypothetical protein